MGFAEIAVLILGIGKLLGAFNIGWLIVFAPMIAFYGFVAVVAIVITIMGLFG